MRFTLRDLPQTVCDVTEHPTHISGVIIYNSIG